MCDGSIYKNQLMFQWYKQKERICDHLIRWQNLTPLHCKSAEDNKYTKNRHQPAECSLEIGYGQHENLAMLSSLYPVFFTSHFLLF